MRFGRFPTTLILAVLLVSSFMAGRMSLPSSASADGINQLTPVYVTWVDKGQYWFKSILNGKEVIPPSPYPAAPICPTSVTDVADLLMTNKFLATQEWSPLGDPEKPGTAWKFISQSGRQDIRVLYGSLDSDHGQKETGITVPQQLGATYRCFQSDYAVAAVAAPPAPVVSAPAPASGSNCVLGRDLANRNGWQVISEPSSVSVYGGAVVQLPLGAQLPPGWEFNGSLGAKPSDGGIFSIYPPNDGTCRASLGVSR